MKALAVGFLAIGSAFGAVAAGMGLFMLIPGMEAWRAAVLMIGTVGGIALAWAVGSAILERRQ